MSDVRCAGGRRESDDDEMMMGYPLDNNNNWTDNLMMGMTTMAMDDYKVLPMTSQSICLLNLRSVLSIGQIE